MELRKKYRSKSYFTFRSKIRFLKYQFIGVENPRKMNEIRPLKKEAFQKENSLPTIHFSGDIR